MISHHMMFQQPNMIKLLVFLNGNDNIHERRWRSLERLVMKGVSVAGSTTAEFKCRSARAAGVAEEEEGEEFGFFFILMSRFNLNTF